MNAIVLLGPPGAGKGTVAEALSAKGYTHISTGELLRQQIALETPLGLEAKQLMDQGKFVPDDAVVGMIRELLEGAAEGQKFLFDGFPRTLVQAQKLDELMKELGGVLSEAILLTCPDQVIVSRLSGRRTCKKCGTVYHLVYNPPSRGDVCDVEGCQLMQRPDDTEVTILKRLEVYAEQTAPLIRYYEGQDLVHSVDATQGINEVRAAVLERLG